MNNNNRLLPSFLLKNEKRKRAIYWHPSVEQCKVIRENANTKDGLKGCICAEYAIGVSVLLNNNSNSRNDQHQLALDYFYLSLSE